MIPSPQSPQAQAWQNSARTRDLLSDWRLTPATMMHHLDSSWIPAKWLQYLSFEIAKAVAKGSCGLLISAPPRHGKSRLSTIGTPLWVLENFPHYNVVVSTYGEELSTDFSREVRDLIQQNQTELSVRLRSDTQRVTNFLTTKGGGLKAVGLKGAITGRGANVLVIDDYIKQPKEAQSPTYLEDLWTWWVTVARTRLEPGAVVIILATRWVANDLHGRIMERQRQTGRTFFKYIELPAIAMEGKQDILGRKPGEVLFPERYNQQDINDIKLDMPSRWFNAMFQQAPDDDETARISKAWFPILSKDEFHSRIRAAITAGHEIKAARGWDFASTKDGGDYTSGALCFYIKATKEFFVYNIRRGQYSPAKAETALEEEAVADHQRWGRLASHSVAIEREPGSSGVYASRHFEGIIKKAVPGLQVKEYPATSAKQLAAAPMLGSAENGRVWLVDDGTCSDTTPEGTGWISDFYSEISTWPEGDHDDQVDSVAVAYRHLSGKHSLSVTFGRNQDKLQLGPPPLVGIPRTSNVTFGRT